MHQGPHPASYIIKDGTEPLATVGKVDPAFRGLTRGWRCALRALPAYSSHVTYVNAHVRSHLKYDNNTLKNITTLDIDWNENSIC